MSPSYLCPVDTIKSFNKYAGLRDQHKYANNYDYRLSILLLNNVYYMTGGSTILVENENLFSPISVIHYEYYESEIIQVEKLVKQDAIQCIIGNDFIPFGAAQQPGLFSYADNIDTMQFLLSL